MGRWQDRLNYFLGLWLFGSPWFLEHSMLAGGARASTWAMFNLWTVGLCVVLLSSIVLDEMKAWHALVIAGFGLWLLVSPWILGFSSSPVLMWNSVICGALIFVLAGWRASNERRYSSPRQWH